MFTLEKAITEYLRLARLGFSVNNPNVPLIFSAAATSLASKLWVDGSDYWPGIFYIALIGDPGTGKTSFVEKYLLLFSGSEISMISTGSPQAMVIDIDDVKHGYIFFDELKRIVDNIDGYMAELIPILNIAYYLGEIGQTRTDKKRRTVVPAGSYFIHVYFTGLPEHWSVLERKAAGGFVRRTLVIPVGGQIPFYKKDHRDPSMRAYIDSLRAKIKYILRLLSAIDITVVLPDYPHLARMLATSHIHPEKKLMIHEYSQKIIAARVVNNLITFDEFEDVMKLTVLDLVERMEQNAQKVGVDVKVIEKGRNAGVVKIIVPDVIKGDKDESKNTQIDQFLPPHFEVATFKLLMNTLTSTIKAPDPVTMKNVERIQQWLKSGGEVVMSKTKFIQEILNTRNPDSYRAAIEILEEGGYIRVVDYMRKRRPAKYIILDPKARICANCAHYRDPKECPLIKDVFDFKEAATKVPPWKAACEKFEEVEE